MRKNCFISHWNLNKQMQIEVNNLYAYLVELEVQKYLPSFPYK